jgi:hypothetical protein
MWLSVPLLSALSACPPVATLLVRACYGSSKRCWHHWLVQWPPE